MKTPEIFKSTKDNTIYISTKAAGIEIMVAVLDGLRVLTFDENKTAHLLFTQVTAWYEKEIELGGDTEGQKRETLDTLRRIEKDFAGQLKEDTSKAVDMSDNTAQGTNGKQERA